MAMLTLLSAGRCGFYCQIFATIDYFLQTYAENVPKASKVRQNSALTF
jgi:hypothetical protein